jgi:hypothetical protein
LVTVSPGGRRSPRWGHHWGAALPVAWEVSEWKPCPLVDEHWQRLLASHPLWKCHLLDLACSVDGERRLYKMCGPFGGGGSSVASVVASMCDECNLHGKEVGRGSTGSILGQSYGWNSLDYTTSSLAYHFGHDGVWCVRHQINLLHLWSSSWSVHVVIYL